MEKKAVAVITARGGSKRIPGKNLKEFCGKPILYYSIQAALDSQCFDEVMVSTDNNEIAKIAMEYGASVPFMRSADASSDYASTVDALLDVFDSYEKSSLFFQYFCCIYPTAPFITAQKLRTAMDMLITTGANSIIPIVPYSFPPQRCFQMDGDRIKIHDPASFSMRSQDLEPLYHDCGQYYCCNTEWFLQNKSLIGEHTLPIVTSELEVQDIDTVDDWKLAEIKYRMLHS